MRVVRWRREADDRRLTVIVVPHGDLETRTFEIPYRRIKLALGVAAVLLVVFAVVLSTWWYIAAQAARVPGLVDQLERLEEERRQVAELARTVAELEAQYERVRQLLGPGREGAPVLPPLRSGASPGPAAAPTGTPPEDGSGLR